MTETEQAKRKRQTLALAARAAKKASTTDSELSAVLRFASEHGASRRELAEATGLPHMTVKRRIERTRAAGST